MPTNLCLVFELMKCSEKNQQLTPDIINFLLSMASNAEVIAANEHWIDNTLDRKNSISVVY